MQEFVPYCYKIECLSNLHAGSGDNNYGSIDNQVQRDIISKVPVIHASSLKGAIREYFDVMTNLEKEKMALIFGSPKNDRDNMQQGEFRFLEAKLFSIPVRGTDHKPYYRAISKASVEEFNRLVSAFKPEFKIDFPSPEIGTGGTEYGEMKIVQIPVFGHEFAHAPDEVFQLEILSNLPVIARNSLDNGQSENLWYEEVVPRESIFYFIILAPTKPNNPIDFEKDFNQFMEGQLVQIGANATVGYGCCKVSKLF